MAFNLENKLTNRERFRRLMSGEGPIDRVPALEWASWWDKTITLWEQNGMPSGLDTQELYDYFQLDSIAQFWFPHKTEDCPQDVSHGSGIIETFEDYERIRPYILPENAVELMREQIEQTLPRYQSGETIVWYTIEGFFWWPRVLFGIENHLYAFYDQPELYHRICEDLLQWQIKIIDDFAKYMHADFMTIAEDMSYNLGPMLSEELYNEFMKPYYLRLIPEIKKHGTKVFIDSDGDITKAVPWFVSSGIEGILPLERQAGVDLAKLRQDWPELLMMGGFDKMCMFKGPEAIAAEFKRLRPTIEQGRYLPAMDHQTPPGVSMENYRYYINLLKQQTMKTLNVQSIEQQAIASQPFAMRASKKPSWIWPSSQAWIENRRACFVDSFLVESVEDPVLLNISAETRYIAYLNGAEIGRGPIRSPQDKKYYDQYDLSSHLTVGDNYLSVRVWDYGWSTYQSLASTGGLIYEIVQAGICLTCSDSTTLAKLDTGHKNRTVKRNVNLGFGDHYDARVCDQNWITCPGITTNWPFAEEIESVCEQLEVRPIRQFTTELRRPLRIIEKAEVEKGCQQVTINTRPVFFPERRDADETIFTGFMACVIDAPTAMEGKISFPFRTWNGIIGDFRIDDKEYAVSNSNRDINVDLRAGRQLMLMNISGKFDDLYIHLSFCFEQTLGLDFYLIGPIDRIEAPVDGHSRVLGGLNEYNRMEQPSQLFAQISQVCSIDELWNYSEYIKPAAPNYVFYDEHIYSLAKEEKIVRKLPIMSSDCGLLSGNLAATIIEPPQQGDYSRIIVDFGDIYVGSLEFSIRATAGTIMDIYCFENMYQGDIDFTIGLNNSVRYICREGQQSYSCMSRMGCRYAMITLRLQTGTVEISDFAIKHSVYSTGSIGRFRCSDELTNKIWEISVNTHRLSMEDAFTDCPTYEQSYWIGDAQISSIVNAWVFGDYELIRHNLLLATTARANTPLFNALTPTDWTTSIPLWTMNWIESVNFYLNISGDQTIVEQLFDQIVEVLRYYSEFIDQTGAFLINAWNMIDWAPMDIHNHGVVTAQQAVLAHCYGIAAGFAAMRNRPEIKAEFEELRQRLLSYIDNNLWSDRHNAYIDGWSPEHGNSKTCSVQTHTMLYLFDGIIDSDKLAICRKLLDIDTRAEGEDLINSAEMIQIGSPFMLYYLYESYAGAGRIKHILEDMRIRWQEMIKYDSTTCWEVFPGFYEVSRTRSYCHSWSSSPAYFLSRYVTGIAEHDAGMKTLKIDIPETDIDWCETTVPTPHGAVNIRWTRDRTEQENNQLYVEYPSAITIEAPPSRLWTSVLRPY